MLAKTKTSIYWLSSYLVTLPIITFLLVAFSPRPHFQSMPVEPKNSQENISLGLPIDKKEKVRLESGFGERIHPTFGDKRMHTGIDLVAGEGIFVMSTEGGLVLEAKYMGAWGNKVIIQHGDTYTTSYSHLKFMHVKKGDKVSKGQTIGLVGNTGLSTKNHLHFEVLKNGQAVDPIQYMPEISQLATDR